MSRRAASRRYSSRPPRSPAAAGDHCLGEIDRSSANNPAEEVQPRTDLSWPPLADRSDASLFIEWGGWPTAARAMQELLLTLASVAPVAKSALNRPDLSGDQVHGLVNRYTRGSYTHFSLFPSLPFPRSAETFPAASSTSARRAKASELARSEVATGRELTKGSYPRGTAEKVWGRLSA